MRPSKLAVELGRVDAPLALDALDHRRLARLADVDRLERHLRRLRPRDPERPQPALVPDPPRLLERRHLDLGIDPLGEVPQPLAPGAAGDRDLAAQQQQLEHLRHVLGVRPAARRPGHDAPCRGSRARRAGRSCRAAQGCRGGSGRCRAASCASARRSGTRRPRRAAGRGRSSAGRARRARTACRSSRACRRCSGR